jgi:hypothetical protein
MALPIVHHHRDIIITLPFLTVPHRLSPSLTVPNRPLPSFTVMKVKVRGGEGRVCHDGLWVTPTKNGNGTAIGWCGMDGNSNGGTKWEKLVSNNA